MPELKINISDEQAAALSRGEAVTIQPPQSDDVELARWNCAFIPQGHQKMKWHSDDNLAHIEDPLGAANHFVIHDISAGGVRDISTFSGIIVVCPRVAVSDKRYTMRTTSTWYFTLDHGVLRRGV